MPLSEVLLEDRPSKWRVEDESLWLEMLSARNRMSHTCDSSTTLSIYPHLTEFLQTLQQLHLNLKTHCG